MSESHKCICLSAPYRIAHCNSWRWAACCFGSWLYTL